MHDKINNIKRNIEITISVENEINNILDLQTKNLYSILKDINTEYDIIDEAEHIINSMSWKGRIINIFNKYKNKFINTNNSYYKDKYTNKELKSIFLNFEELKNINTAISDKLNKHNEYLNIILYKKSKLDYKIDKFNKKISKYI